MDRSGGIRQDWKDWIPERGVGFERGDDDLVVLIKPKFEKGPLKVLRRLVRHPNFRVRLDSVGTHFWMRCDGVATLGDICASLHDRFGESVEPVEERLKAFLKQLVLGGFVKCREPGGTETAGGV